MKASRWETSDSVNQNRADHSELMKEQLDAVAICLSGSGLFEAPIAVGDPDGDPDRLTAIDKLLLGYPKASIRRWRIKGMSD